MPEMQFKKGKEEILRVLLCRYRKTSGRNRCFSGLHLLQQDLLQYLSLKIPETS